MWFLLKELVSNLLVTNVSIHLTRALLFYKRRSNGNESLSSNVCYTSCFFWIAQSRCVVGPFPVFVWRVLKFLCNTVKSCKVNCTNPENTVDEWLQRAPVSLPSRQLCVICFLVPPVAGMGRVLYGIRDELAFFNCTVHSGMFSNCQTCRVVHMSVMRFGNIAKSST